MYRVRTKHRDHCGHVIVEAGPWHMSKGDAEHWADMLRQMGYIAQIESTSGLVTVTHGNDDLADALSSMA